MNPNEAAEVCPRIKFFLVAHSFSDCVVNKDTEASNAPDYKARKLSLELTEDRRGPGLWKCNNSLVHDEEYVKHIKENYPIIGEKYRDLDDHRLKWSLLKWNKGPYNRLFK